MMIVIIMMVAISNDDSNNNDSSYSHFTRNICNRYVQSFQTSLGHDQKHAVRLLRLYEDEV